MVGTSKESVLEIAIEQIVTHSLNFEPQALRHFEQISHLQEQIESAETRAALAFSSAALPGPKVGCQLSLSVDERRKGGTHREKPKNKSSHIIPIFRIFLDMGYFKHPQPPVDV